MDWAITWPLYTVYPISTLLFTGLYLAGPLYWPLILPYYGKMSTLNRKCWRQNTNAMLHTLILCPLLLVAIMTDPDMRALRPLHPHHNTLGYVALCWSLGYFTFTIPWSYYLYCFQGERRATNLALCIHHVVVWIAALTYLLGRTCALYGAVGFAAMEFTNWFFIAHILQQSVRSKWYTLWNANFLVLVVVGVIGMRLVLCTYMLVLFSQDIATFSSDSPVEWALVTFQYVIFIMVVILSWVFIWYGIKDAGLDKVARRKLHLDQPYAKGELRRTPSGDAKPGRALRSNTKDATASKL